VTGNELFPAVAQDHFSGPFPRSCRGERVARPFSFLDGNWSSINDAWITTNYQRWLVSSVAAMNDESRDASKTTLSLFLSLSFANPSTADFPKSTGVYGSTLFRIVPSGAITRWTTLARAAVRPGRWQPVLFPFYIPSCDNDQWSLESPQQQQQQQQQH